MANKFAKDFSEDANHDFGSFVSKNEAINQESMREGAKGSSDKVSSEKPNSKQNIEKPAQNNSNGAAKVNQGSVDKTSYQGLSDINSVQDAKNDVKADIKSSMTGENRDTIKQQEQERNNNVSDAVKRGAKGKVVRGGVAKAGKTTGGKIATRGVGNAIGSKSTGVLHAVRGLGAKTIGGFKSAFSAAATGVTKAGAVVGSALNVSATVGTALVLSGTIAAATIPTVGVVGYGVSHSTQQKDGCVPEEFDEPITFGNLDPDDFVGELEIGQACGGETGIRNQKAGDQSGKEVRRGCSYGSRWTYVIRAKNPATALRIADSVIKACDNDHIGYDQADRKTAYVEAGKVDFNIPAITTDCETTCGELANLAVRAAGVDEEYAPGPSKQSCTATDQLWPNLQKSGEFEKISPSAADALPGDILIDAGDHTAIVVKSPNRIRGVSSVSLNQQTTITSTKAPTPAIASAIGWAKMIAADDSYTYGHGSFKCCICNKLGIKQYTCMPFIAAAYAHGAQDPIMMEGGRHVMHLNENNFKGDLGKIWVKVGLCRDLTMADLQPGDVFIKWDADNWGGHASMYCGGDAIVEATHTKGIVYRETGAAKRLKRYHTEGNTPSKNYVMRYVGSGMGSPLFCGSDYNSLVAEMTADDGCGGEMDGAEQQGAYIGKGMKKVTAGNGEEYIILDFDLEQVKKLGGQGSKQCYIYSIGYCDLILGGKFRCSIDGSADTKHSNMRSAYGSGSGENGSPGNIGGVQKDVASTDAMRKLAIEEIKQGRPVIFYIAGNSYGVSTGQHWICICGWTANAGSDPSWDDLVCCDPAYFFGGGDGLHAIKGFHDHGGHTVATFEGWSPAAGQTKRSQ